MMNIAKRRRKLDSLHKRSSWHQTSLLAILNFYDNHPKISEVPEASPVFVDLNVSKKSLTQTFNDLYDLYVRMGTPWKIYYRFSSGESIPMDSRNDSHRPLVGQAVDVLHQILKYLERNFDNGWEYWQCGRCNSKKPTFEKSKVFHRNGSKNEAVCIGCASKS